MKRALVTGSSGLIGSEVCVDFNRRDFEIHEVDNNQRAVFFGPSGDSRWNQQRLESRLKNFHHHEMDIRNRDGVIELIAFVRPDAIIHTAAQPSHDRVAAIPFDVPWMVMNNQNVAQAFGWRPQTSLEQILSGIAQHHRQNPNWLELSSNK